jgi:hypothetical protein
MCKIPATNISCLSPFKDLLLFSETESGTEEPVTPLGPVAGTLCQEWIVVLKNKVYATLQIFL